MTRRAAWSQSGLRIFAFVERQMLDQRLAIDAHALLARPADRLMRLLAGGVHDIDRAARHVGDHDGAVGRLAFDLGRARIGMRLGAIIALGHQPRLQFGDDIAILGMDERQRAQLGAALERGIHLVVIHHQRALIGHEMLEGVDALVRTTVAISLNTCSPHQVIAMWKP